MCDYCRTEQRIVVFLTGDETWPVQGYGACLRCCDVVLKLYYSLSDGVFWPTPERLFDQLVREVMASEVPGDGMKRRYL